MIEIIIISTGVPHILEHSVLCGSRKFPVKEPFVDLLKGSLQNFLNAFTYPDRTCYPVASTNTKDFYNLIHVYLDAVLNPRAINDPQVLEQEGWHYELDKVEDPLKIKGVVFNEMKGVYSSPDSLMGRAVQQALFPSNTYGVDSGGDPQAIPTLSFEQFRTFHSNYYHPSNSRIFFYGDDDPYQRLELLDEYLSEFDRKVVDSRIQYQPKLNSDLGRVTVPFPLAPGTEPKHMVSVNWMLNDHALSTEEMLAIGVLDYLLLGTSTSSLRKVLVESNLGESVIGGGISDELLQATFSAGLKGVKKEDVKKVEDLVQATLARIAEEGFEADAIEAAMNTIEFRLRKFHAY
jgi:presequence protease